MEDVLQQYTRFVKPSHDDFIAPSKRIADIIIPWHKTDNLVAVDLIVGVRLSCLWFQRWSLSNYAQWFTSFCSLQAP